MTYDNVKIFLGVTRRSVIDTIMIVFTLVIGISGTLMIGTWMMTVILSNSVLQTLKNYEGFTN